MVAVMSIVVVWLSVAWTAMTGLTWATRSAPGRNASEEDRTRARHVAVLTTVIAGPIALLAARKRRQSD